jgi:RNA 2',3'-cyclic 3'-phosphodiesterase
MSRLFVALELPDTLRAQLVHMQPQTSPGLRCVAPANLHLTLHFIGEAAVEPTIAALDTVTFDALRMTAAGVGRFTTRGGAILWVGFEPCPALVPLHADIARALGAIGFVPEARPYAPHVTIARCDGRVPRDALKTFETHHAAFRGEAFDVDEFVLMESTLGPTGPTYRVAHRVRARGR